jgi:hypothetical protein
MQQSKPLKGSTKDPLKIRSSVEAVGLAVALNYLFQQGIFVPKTI